MSTRESKTDGIEPWVIHCIVLRLNEQEALAYLSDKGYDISPAEYYRIKAEIRDNTQSRLNLIAQEGWYSEHLQRLDSLKTVESELWVNYHKETNPRYKANILVQISQLQELLASFMDSTTYVLERGAKLRKRKREQEQTV